MNTYFYPASTSKCQDYCCYNSCSNKCLSLLSDIPSLENLTIITGGSKLQTPTSMGMRSGDVIILYASNTHDIDSLVSIKDFFDTFRIILIVGKENLLRYAPHHHLTPRYKMSMDQSLSKIGEVIDRMNVNIPNIDITNIKSQEHNHG